jgi:hypothetical protein
MTFRKQEYPNVLDLFYPQNVFNLDLDKDNDLDTFFSFYNSNILYQLVNNGITNNLAPTIPVIDSV